ncbi:hypothetical protein Lalb_Chr15g0080601 [Lupinus albus]|uniref:Transmembrane protein n=1 Tax=Lupinus albus TaxID=3870 RepID=A0A6A4NXW9_LUPAL|nr:hypothetical protein Lalb_Chr15g0080601 [Lupinus albus]
MAIAYECGVCPLVCMCGFIVVCMSVFIWFYDCWPVICISPFDFSFVVYG